MRCAVNSTRCSHYLQLSVFISTKTSEHHHLALWGRSDWQPWIRSCCVVTSGWRGGRQSDRAGERERERMRREWRIDENRLWHIGMRDGLLTVDHWNVSAAHKTSSDSFSWSNYPPQPDIWDVEPVRRNRWTEQLLADESEARCALSLFIFSFSQLGTCYVLLPGFPSPSPLCSPCKSVFFSPSPSLCFSFRRWQTAPPAPFTVIIRSETHWLVQKFKKKKKCRVCMCMQVRESRLSRKGELCVSMQFNARVWSRDCLLSACFGGR